MKYLSVLLVTSVLGACASNPAPPVASSESIDLATNTPSTSTEPVATDMTRAQDADRKAESNVGRSSANARPVDDGTIASPPARTTAPAAATAPANPPTPASAGAPDNSRVNERDRSGDSLTAADQGSSEGDRKLTQQIRQAVMKDKSLSFTAKNVKIITLNGKVTLRGPVNTEQERNAIDAAARGVAGASHVENLLEIKK